MISNYYLVYLFLFMTLIYLLFFQKDEIEHMENEECKCENLGSVAILNNINKITKQINDLEKENKNINNEMNKLKPIVEKNKKITDQLVLEVAQFNKDMAEQEAEVKKEEKKKR